MSIFLYFLVVIKPFFLAGRAGIEPIFLRRLSHFSPPGPTREPSHKPRIPPGRQRLSVVSQRYIGTGRTRTSLCQCASGLLESHCPHHRAFPPGCQKYYACSVICPRLYFRLKRLFSSFCYLLKSPCYSNPDVNHWILFWCGMQLIGITASTWNPSISATHAISLCRYASLKRWPKQPEARSNASESSSRKSSSNSI